MKTKISIIAAMLLFSICAIAQTNYEDVVYLKNGSIIHGMIIETVPNQTIKIQTKDRNVFVYKMDEIEKITKEPMQTTSPPELRNEIPNIKQSGYTNITELDFGLGVSSDTNSYSYGIQTVNGYLINQYFSMGIGLGIEKYNALFLPIFVDFRGNLLNSLITPFFDVSLGYSFGINNSSGLYTSFTNNAFWMSYYKNTITQVNKGGLLVNLSIGMKFFVSSKYALNFSVGYRYQENSLAVSYIDRNEQESFTKREKVNVLNLKLGATF